MRPLASLRRVWAETSRGLRSTSLVMWAMAAGGTVAGVVGDQHGWWDDRAFLTNLTSSLVTALFGVPVALIVIRRISAAESDRLDRAAAVRFARLTVGRLLEDLEPLVPDPVAAGALRDRLRALDDRLQARPDHHGSAPLEVLAEWAAVADALPAAVRAGAPAADALRDAEATWRFLGLHVAPRLQVYDVPWLSRAVSDRVEQLFDRAERFARADPRQTGRLADAARGRLARRQSAPGGDRLHDADADADLWIGVEEQVDVLLDGVASLVELRETVTTLAGALPGPRLAGPQPPGPQPPGPQPPGPQPPGPQPPGPQPPDLQPPDLQRKT